MDFVSKNWFALLMVGIIIFIVVDTQNRVNLLERKKYKLESRITELNSQIFAHSYTIDSLKNIDNTIIKEIEVIKLVKDETIKFIDTMSVSSMQSVFAARYSKE